MNPKRLIPCALGILLLTTAAHAQTVAITNAKIYTVAGPTTERGTVLIQDGRIAAVGASVAVPADARVIDGAGKIVTPGLLDSSTGLGVVEVGSVPGSSDQSENSDRITAAFNVADGLNPLSTLIPVTRVEGITRAVVQPSNGAALIQGQGILIVLDGTVAPSMIVKNPTAMYITFGEDAAQRSGGTRSATILRLREAFDDARDYARNRRAYDAAQRRPYALSRLDLEALQPVLEGKIPVVFEVSRASDIMNALRFAREQNVKAILSGAEEGWIVAADIARANVPVLLQPMHNIPGFEKLGITLENAARLNAAGVRIAFASYVSHNSRNLKQEAGNAISYGLPFDVALRAVTLTPAQIWGVADRYGTLEPGKDADVVVWSGDPFELTTQVEHVFIRGREISMDTRQRDLLQRYRTLGPMPPAYKH
jgi:imidazolonepropionase-like amidohydrolase